MHRTFSRLACSASAVLFVVTTAWPAAAQPSSCGRTPTREQNVQRLLDIAEIQNAASLHEYYHTALQHREEIENVWSSREDVSWTNNTDRYANRKSLWAFYVDGLKESDPKGAMWYHMLTTPVIEVAGDGQTARAVYMSFGSVSGILAGKSAAQWTQERYGIDFIKENGRWKIWHLRTFVDFYVDTDKRWLDPASNGAAVETRKLEGRNPDGTPLSAGVKEEPGVTFNSAKPDEKRNFYPGYTTDRQPQSIPLPVPYCTWNDIKSPY